MVSLTEEFRDLHNRYVKLAADLARIADTGKSGEDQQAFIQSILDNQSCLTGILELNDRLSHLYGAWKDKEKNISLSENNEIRAISGDIEKQMRDVGKLCELGVRKVEEWRKQLSDELTTVGKGSSYLKLLKPVQENHPKFIDSAC
jgi:hypothetical protein